VRSSESAGASLRRGGRVAYRIRMKVQGRIAADDFERGYRVVVSVRPDLVIPVSMYTLTYDRLVEDLTLRQRPRRETV
jgi:hypothetical protein